MKKQPYALEERLLLYSVRIINNDIFGETEKLIKIFVTSIETAVRQAHGPKRSRRAEKNRTSKTNAIKLRSGATSLFDVRRWTLDVGRSMFSLFDLPAMP
jgi:hypothetical protein